MSGNGPSGRGRGQPQHPAPPSSAGRGRGRGRGRALPLTLNTLNLEPPAHHPPSFLPPSRQGTPTTPTWARFDAATGFPGPGGPAVPGRALYRPATPTTPGTSSAAAADLCPYSDKLPANKKRDILSSYGFRVKGVAENGDKVGLVTGKTGCGKSQLIPTAFFWVNQREVRESQKKIILCEPTRIAASLIYDRIKQIGSVCGLLSDQFGKKIGIEEEHFKNCNFGVTTAGYLVEKLTSNADRIYDYFAIIVDEAHSLDEDTSVLIGILRCLQWLHHQRHGVGHTQMHGPRFPDFIFISATLDRHVFYDLFIPVNNYGVGRVRPSVDDVTFKMTTEVNWFAEKKSMFLEDLESKWGLRNDVQSARTKIMKSAGGIPKFHPETMVLVFKSINKIYLREDFKTYREGAIIVALPGVGDINQCMDYYKTVEKKMAIKLRLLPLYSKLGHAAIQKNVDTANGNRDGTVNVLLATSIINNSVTLSKVKVVIDSGIIKQPKFNKDTYMNALANFHAGAVIMEQRAGRTGRCCDGLYIALIPKNFEQSGPPNALMRVNLEDIYMRVLKFFKSKHFMPIRGLVTRFFREFVLYAPPSNNIEAAIMCLTNKGLIYRKSGPPQTHSPYDHYILTELGLITTTIKFSPNLTRACMTMGSFGSTETMAIIGCENMDRRSDLIKQGTKSLVILHALKDFSLDTLSDTLTIAAMFRAWYKSKFTTRLDGKPKCWKTLLKLTALASRWNDNEFTAEDFVACHIAAFDRIDEDLFDFVQDLLTRNRGKGFTDKYQESDTEDERQKTSVIQRQHETLALHCTTSPEQHFMSAPSSERCNFTFGDISLLNSLILTPCPPSTAFVEDWGYQLMSALGANNHDFPDILVDRENDQVIVTWYHQHENPHLGMLSNAMNDALQRSQFGFKHLFVYRPRNNEGRVITDADRVVIPQAVDEEFEWEEKSVTEDGETTKTQEPEPSRLVEIPSQVSFSTSTVFQITNFIHPHNIGVIIHDPKDDGRVDFLQMIKSLWERRNSFQPFTLADHKFGRKVIYIDPNKKPDKRGMDNNKWNQRWARCIVSGPIFPDGCEKLSPGRQANARVQIYLMDHGTTQVVFLKHLKRFDEENCHYGFPEAFSSIPPMGWRVMLSSVKPFEGHQWQWAGWVKSAMGTAIQNIQQFGPKCRLDVEYISESNRIIVAKDLFPLKTDTGRSFTNYLITARLASPLTQVIVCNKKTYENGPDFLRRPACNITLDDYKSKNEKMLKEYNKDKTNFSTFTFEKVYSPLQFDIKQVLPQLGSFVELKIQNGSLGFCGLDHRLARSDLSEANYDPVMITALDCSSSEYTDNQLQLLCTTLYSRKVTISYPVAGYVPIVEMISHPAVEIVFAKKERLKDGVLKMIKLPYAARLYKNNGHNEMINCGEILFRVLFSQADFDTINELRQFIQNVHSEPEQLDAPQTISEKIDALVQRPRSQLIIDTPASMPPFHAFEFMDNTFMIPEVVKSYCD